MTMRGRLVFIAVSLLAFLGKNSVYAQTSFYKDAGRGWHWYEKLPTPIDEDGEDKVPPASTPQSSSPKKPSPPTSSEVVARYKKELENRMATAWIHPTPGNVKAYQEMQKDMVDRSKVFSEVWMQSVFTNPRLDHSLQSPVNQKAVHVQLDLKKQKTEQLMKDLSKSYGLFFFFSTSCEYCKVFAPVVKQFSSLYGWEVVPISMDGGQLESFPKAVPDNGLSQKWGITVLPSLYAVNPTTGQVIPVAHGMTSLDQMETRILALTEDSHGAH